MNATLLVELLTEELPPKALAKLGEAFAAAPSSSRFAKRATLSDAESVCD